MVVRCWGRGDHRSSAPNDQRPIPNRLLLHLREDILLGDDDQFLLRAFVAQVSQLLDAVGQCELFTRDARDEPTAANLAACFQATQDL